jgi:hypothetical protein
MNLVLGEIVGTDGEKHPIISLHLDKLWNELKFNGKQGEDLEGKLWKIKIL